MQKIRYSQKRKYLTQRKNESVKQCQAQQMNARNQKIGKVRGNMVRSAFKSAGMAVGLGILFGPVQAYVSQKVWKTWGCVIGKSKHVQHQE